MTSNEIALAAQVLKLRRALTFAIVFTNDGLVQDHLKTSLQENKEDLQKIGYLKNE